MESHEQLNRLLYGADQPLRVGESLAKTLCKVEPQCFIGHVLARVEVANSQSWTPCHAVCYGRMAVENRDPAGAGG